METIDLDTDPTGMGYAGRRRHTVEAYERAQVILTLADGERISGELLLVTSPRPGEDPSGGSLVVNTPGVGGPGTVSVDLTDVAEFRAGHPVPGAARVDDRAGVRIALKLATYADKRQGQRLTDLPHEDVMYALGLAHALGAATQRSYGGDGEWYEGELAYLHDAINDARKIVESFQTWSRANADDIQEVRGAEANRWPAPACSGDP